MFTTARWQMFGNATIYKQVGVWTKYNVTQVPTAITYNSAIYSFQAPHISGSEFGAEEAGGILVAISGGLLTFFDPTTGNQILSYPIPVSSGTIFNDPYVLSVQNLGHSHYALINWTLNTESSNFADRIISNVTFPYSSLGTVDYQTGIACRVTTISPPQALADYGTNVSAVSLTTGQILWTENITDTISGSPALADHGTLAFACMLRHWDAFDEQTGKQVWTTTYYRILGDLAGAMVTHQLTEIFMLNATAAKLQSTGLPGT